MKRLVAVLLGACLVSASASAADLKVLSGNGSRPAVIELSARFEKATGHKVNIEFYVNPTGLFVIGGPDGECSTRRCSTISSNKARSSPARAR